MDSVLSWERWWFSVQAVLSYEHYLLTKNPMYLDFEEGFCRIAFDGAPEA
jgi:hypothetical protein